MTRHRSAFVGLVLSTAMVSAQSPPPRPDPTGSWKAVFTGTIAERPKPYSDVIFTVRETPAGLMVTARAGRWPGELDVSDATLKGDRFTFTGTGKEGWSSGTLGAMQYHCCPKLILSVTIGGDEMKGTLTSTSTEPDAEPGRDMPIEAKRLSAIAAR